MTTDYHWPDASATDAHRWLVPAVTSLLPAGQGQCIIDLGCGNGYLSGLLAGAGHRVVALDSSPEGIRIAREQFPAIEFHCASVYDPLASFVGGGFDVAIATELIEHLYDPRRFLLGAYALLRPGGTLILTTPYHGYFKNLALALSGRMDKHFTVDWDGGHIKFFSPATLKAMIEDCGFENCEFKFVGRLPLLWKSMVVRAMRGTGGLAT
jgi:2-polyprenyl-6-hydroxyphenyl methylase/3-demethylubiquinone-9 3-methyltransferase